MKSLLGWLTTYTQWPADASMGIRLHGKIDDSNQDYKHSSIISSMTLDKCRNFLASCPSSTWCESPLNDRTTLDIPSVCEMKTKLSRTSWFQGELLFTSIESGNCLRCPTSCRRHDLCRRLHTLHVADTIFAAEPTITQTLICDWSIPRACHYIFNIEYLIYKMIYSWYNIEYLIYKNVYKRLAIY